MLLKKLIPRYLVGIFLTYSFLLSFVNYSNFSFVKFNTLLFNPIWILIMSESSPERRSGNAASHQVSVTVLSPRDSAVNATLSLAWQRQIGRAVKGRAKSTLWKLNEGSGLARVTSAGQGFPHRETSSVSFTTSETQTFPQELFYLSKVTLTPRILVVTLHQHHHQ